ARPHAELGVDVRQVACDGAFAQEQRRCDLPVRPSLRDEVGNPELCGAQTLCAAAPADRATLPPHPLAPATGAVPSAEASARASRVAAGRAEIRTRTSS